MQSRATEAQAREWHRLGDGSAVVGALIAMVGASCCAPYDGTTTAVPADDVLAPTNADVPSDEMLAKPRGFGSGRVTQVRLQSLVRPVSPVSLLY